MKKILFAAVAALAIVGCTQNEEFDNLGSKAEINFKSVVGKNTRAVEMDLPGLKNAGFNVYAYNTGTDLAGAGVLDNPIMENSKITWATNAWTGDKTYYWPSTDNVQFFAYASSTVNALTASATDKYPTIVDYTVPTAAASQEDLLVAKATDLTKAKGTTVSFTFSHALTQVNFSIKPKVADNFTYVVTGISLENIGSVATYSYDSGWTAPATPISYACALSATEDDNSVTSGKTTALGEEPLMLLPQTLGDNAQIVIKYKVLDSKGKEYYATAEAGKAISIKGEAWAANKKMRYTLALTNDATPISWDVTSVDGWTSDSNTESNADKDAPVDTPTVK